MSSFIPQNPLLTQLPSFIPLVPGINGEENQKSRESGKSEEREKKAKSENDPHSRSAPAAIEKTRIISQKEREEFRRDRSESRRERSYSPVGRGGSANRKSDSSERRSPAPSHLIRDLREINKVFVECKGKAWISFCDAFQKDFLASDAQYAIEIVALANLPTIEKHLFVVNQGERLYQLANQIFEKIGQLKHPSARELDQEYNISILTIAKSVALCEIFHQELRKKIAERYTSTMIALFKSTQNLEEWERYISTYSSFWSGDVAQAALKKAFELVLPLSEIQKGAFSKENSLLLNRLKASLTKLLENYVPYEKGIAAYQFSVISGDNGELLELLAKEDQMQRGFKGILQEFERQPHTGGWNAFKRICEVHIKKFSHFNKLTALQIAAAFPKSSPAEDEPLFQKLTNEIYQEANKFKQMQLCEIAWDLLRIGAPYEKLIENAKPEELKFFLSKCLGRLSLLADNRQSAWEEFVNKFASRMTPRVAACTMHTAVNIFCESKDDQLGYSFTLLNAATFETLLKLAFEDLSAMPIEILSRLFRVLNLFKSKNYQHWEKLLAEMDIRLKQNQPLKLLDIINCAHALAEQHSAEFDANLKGISKLLERLIPHTIRSIAEEIPSRHRHLAKLTHAFVTYDVYHPELFALLARELTLCLKNKAPFTIGELASISSSFEQFPVQGIHLLLAELEKTLLACPSSLFNLKVSSASIRAFVLQGYAKTSSELINRVRTYIPDFIATPNVNCTCLSILSQSYFLHNPEDPILPGILEHLNKNIQVLKPHDLTRSHWILSYWKAFHPNLLSNGKLQQLQQKSLETCLAAPPNPRNKSERDFEELLKTMKIIYNQAANIKGFEVDFLLQAYKPVGSNHSPKAIVIELDGPTHEFPANKLREFYRDRIIQHLGYTIIRIPLHKLMREANKANFTATLLSKAFS